jgi:hypothetical protein
MEQNLKKNSCLFKRGFPVPYHMGVPANKGIATKGLNGRRSPL